MNKFSLLLLHCLLCSLPLWAQSPPQPPQGSPALLDSLIKEGVSLHDQGAYPKALRQFKRVLALQPAHPSALYEMSMTLAAMGRLDEALYYADKVLQHPAPMGILAYTAKGNILDQQGKRKASIRTLQEGVQRHGPHYMLCFNLGVSYMGDGQAEKAQESFEQALLHNINHPGSHLQLGRLLRERRHRLQSILCLHYFLLLEPFSQRSKQAYTLLQDQLAGDLRKQGPDVVLSVDQQQLNSPFAPAEMAISLQASQKMVKEQPQLSEMERFVQQTRMLFSLLPELKAPEKPKQDALHWNFYIPLFANIGRSPHLEAYCYYISAGVRPEARTWLREHPQELDAFQEWVADQNE